jgi:hypothetical protein
MRRRDFVEGARECGGVALGDTSAAAGGAGWRNGRQQNGGHEHVGAGLLLLLLQSRARSAVVSVNEDDAGPFEGVLDRLDTATPCSVTLWRSGRGIRWAAIERTRIGLGSRTTKCASAAVSKCVSRPAPT